MTAFFTDEEKLAGIKALVDPVPVAGLSEQTVAILEAVAADYETGIATGRRVGLVDGAVDEIATKESGFTPVTSSNIHSLKYDGETRELTVRFHTGWVYAYYGIDHSSVRAIMNSGSFGGAFWKQVVKGGYRSEKKENWK